MTTHIFGHQFVATPGVLTPREAEAALWTAEGKTKEEVALIIGCTARTVRAHIENGMAKIGARNLPNYVARLMAAGALDRAARSVAPVLLSVLVVHSMVCDTDHPARRARSNRTEMRVERIRREGAY